MPRVDGDALQFIYLCDPTRVIDEHAQTVSEIVPSVAAEQFRGGSQALPFDGGWLALVHEVGISNQVRLYHHRFVWIDGTNRLRGVSRPFFFEHRGIEYAAGLAWHPDRARLVVSYGVDDGKSRVATVDIREVRRLLDDVGDLPSGVPASEGRTKLLQSGAVASAAPNETVLTKPNANANSEECEHQDRSEAAGNFALNKAALSSDARGVALGRSAAHGTAARYSEMQVSEGLFDQPPCPVRAKVFICATERTGSWLLCRAMFHHGIGVPHEYFNNKHTGLIGPRFGIQALADGRQLGSDSIARRAYIEALLDRRTANGIFAAKIHWWRFAAYLDNPEGVELFQGAHFIHLYREDLLGQAITFHLSKETGRWVNDDAVVTPPASSARFFDADVIDKRMETLAKSEMNWRLFFARNSIFPLSVSYERMRDDLPGVLHDIAGSLGLDVPAESLEYVEEGPKAERDAGAPPRSSIKAKFLLAHQRVTPAPRALARAKSTRKLNEIRENGRVAANESGKLADGERVTGITSERRVAKASPEGAAYALKSADEIFRDLAPFLGSVDLPKERREASRAFDERLAPLLAPNEAAGLPQIHCFYEVMSDAADRHILVAAMKSMRAAGHPVRLWSYTPKKLDFLAAAGVELRQAADVVPKGLYDRIVARSEIRYFSDIFRYAALYEHGGLWMDTDIILLRPFPYRGSCFLNLQWRGGHQGHFICGNVMGAEPFSRHMRALYEASIERFFAAKTWEFGLIGPKLLSDYVASAAGAELQQFLFSPMLFNAIDWMEIDHFGKPVSELADYLNDDRLFGVHLWTANNRTRVDGGGAPLISLLTEPGGLPNFADRFNTDKNCHTSNRHCYARINDRLLSTCRFSTRRLMEIGLCRILADKQSETPSVALWQSYFPFCRVVGVDLTDFSRLNNERFTSYVCDQSKRDDLRAVAAKLEPGSFDVIIDDGSHASADEQLTLVEFWPLLADGGWYFIEDLDWQPPGEDRAKIALTKTLLGEMKEHRPLSLDPLGVGALASEIDEILFFDSHYELVRARLLGGLVAIRKRGGSGLAR